MTDDQSPRRDAVDRLTDALCNDILKAPGDELLAEVAEDYRDPRALAMEFDRIFERVQQNSSAPHAVGRFRRVMDAIRKSRISLSLSERPRAPQPDDLTHVAAAALDGRRGMLLHERIPGTANARVNGLLALHPITAVVGLALVVTTGLFGYYYWSSSVIEKEIVTADASRTHDKVEAAFLEYLGREVVTRGVPVVGLSPLPETYVVQVASQRSEAEAQASYRALQARYPSVLGSRRATITRADLGDKGVFYRAEVGPFVKAEEADEMCKSLKAAGGQCLVQGIQCQAGCIDPPRTDTVAPR